MSSKSYLGVSMTAAESTEDIQPEGTLFRGMGFCSFGFDDKDKVRVLLDRSLISIFLHVCREY